MGENSPAFIRLESISKSFGTVHANRDISLDIHFGKIKALLGENGAGKSTLMGMLAGQLQPDKGSICLHGKPVAFSSTKAAIKAGIGMVYQHFMLVETMTVAENVFLGQEEGFFLQPKKMEDLVKDLAETYGLQIDPCARISDLSMGEKQRVEILKLLQRRSQLLIFDEPTAVLTPQEAIQLFTSLKQMARQGKAIVFISHKLDEVLEIADEIAVLRHGRVVDSLNRSDVNSKSELAQLMIGRDIMHKIDKRPLEPKQMVLRVKDLCDNVLKHINFEVRQGEVLGIVGVAGNGQKPLVETVCGLKPVEQGDVSIFGEPWYRFFSRRSWSNALCYIPEDRRGLASCLNLDLVDNFLLTTREGFSKGPWLNKREAEKKVQGLIDAFGVQPKDARILARQLSGGNLQKMVLAREFYRRPRLIVAEQPTQGLDIAATEDIWNLLLKAKDKAGILLLTGDLTEALSLSDRIAVMYEGRIMDTFYTHDTQKINQIGLMMAGIVP
ncbi:MAG: ABC transporter ATP-binding protein [Desulfobacterales bacterium]|nr:MAG: ABC transporter ATP-binding protein [Desulfobacterales bacterium]UCD89411.1 MAG: ABC transporter ATP-binding protein [Desulfobacterales bacterium]